MLKFLFILLISLLSFSSSSADSSYFNGKINISSSENSATLNWVPSKDSTGRFLNYIIEYREAYLQGENFVYSGVYDGAGGDIRASVLNLKPNTSYNIRITPKDINGSIFPSELLLFTTLSSFKINLSIENKENENILKWQNQSTNINNSTVISYLIEYRKAGIDSLFTTYNKEILSQNTNTFSIKNLTPGSLYEYRMVGIDKGGNQTSVSNSVTTPFGFLPSLPNLGRVSYDSVNNLVNVSWDIQPVDLLYGNRATNYIVESRKGSSLWEKNNIKDLKELSVKLSKIVEPNTLYEFRLSSENSRGINGPTDILSIKTPIKSVVKNTQNDIKSIISEVPGVPGAVAVTPLSNSVEVSLVPGLPGSAPVTAYSVVYKEVLQNDWQTVKITQKTDPKSGEVSLILPNLKNEVSYDIKVAAVNTKGTGTFSNIFQVTPSSKSKKCEPIITSYIKLNSKQNDIENVKRMQIFFRDDLNYKNKVTGFYGSETFSLVKKFQLEYAEDVLKPWKLKKGTGWVYITTKKKINDIYCSIHKE